MVAHSIAVGILRIAITDVRMLIGNNAVKNVLFNEIHKIN